MGYFSDNKNKGEKIGEARGTPGGLYFSPGNFRGTIQRCKIIEVGAKKRPAFVAEFKLTASDSDKLAVGAEPAYYVDLDGEYPDSAKGDVADFMRAGLAALATKNGAAITVDDVEVDEEVADEICGEENILAGVELDINAFNKLTKAGKDFTRMKWRVPGSAA